MNRVARVRIMFVCVFLLSTGCLYLLRQWEDGEEDGDTIKVQSKQNIMDSGVYFRDNHGYIYHKEYFQSTSHLQSNNLFHNASLQGRHSDTVLSACDDPFGNQPSNIKPEYTMMGQFNYLKNYKNPCWYSGGSPTNKTVMCIPYYYFIGTPKAGSSDLFWRIRMHPDVAPYSVKETRWFDASRFNNNSDGSPSYLFNSEHWPELPGNEWCLEPRVTTISYIHNLFPSAKLLLIVRNPVDRLYSDYLFNSKRTGANKTAEEFHSWAKRTIDTYQECFKEWPFRYCLYNRKLKYQSMVHSFTASIYSRLLLDALRIFPRNQLLVLHMEDYSANMIQRLGEVFDFLGLDRMPAAKMREITQVSQYNEGKFYKKAGKMLPVTRKMISSFYKPFNEELAQIMNDEKYLWKEHI